MAVPPPNVSNDPNGLTTVRFFIKDDPVYADVDNRPLSDLWERDNILKGILDTLGTQTSYLADKVGEDLPTPKGTPPTGPPTYTDFFSQNYAITNGQSHREAIGRLDRLGQLQGDFMGRLLPTINPGDPGYPNMPHYVDHGGPEYAVPDLTPLETGIANLDSEANRIKGWLGKDSLTEPLPDYSGYCSHFAIQANDPVRNAIGRLDRAISGAGKARFAGPSGYAPNDTTNPFATVNWVNALISSVQVKRSGGTGGTYGTNQYRVYLYNGSAYSASYHFHSANFVAGGFAACNGSTDVNNHTNTSAGYAQYSTYYTTGSPTTGVTLAYVASMGLYNWGWIAVQ